MYLKLGFLCMVLVYHIPAHGFGNNNGIKRINEEIRKIALGSEASFETQWIEQKVDNFDTNNVETWKMKYYESVEFWEPNGPIYLFIGGEAPAAAGYLKTGLLYEMAQETNGAMFLSEHRYYGESQPVNGRSVEDLKYLTVSQALADNANLLRNIKKNDKYQNSKVVVIGGSYAGNLAAWMKLVYPDLVDAVVASSGPVLAKRDFFEYIEVVGKDYKNYGTPGCYENIQKIFQNKYDKLFQSDEGIKQLKEEENICAETDFSKPENRQLFFDFKMEGYMSNAQYGTTQSIQEYCGKISTATHEMFNNTDIDQYYWNINGKCLDIDFQRAIEELRKKEHDNILCWIYQTCTEFGYFQSTDSDDHPFTRNLPAEFYDKMCTALFGDGFDKDRVENGVTKTNKVYGGRTPKVSNVIFVNGGLDPWSALGVSEDLSNNVKAINIAQSSHCRVLLPNREGDPEELKEARLNIKKIIKGWIGVDNRITNVLSLLIPN